MNFNPSDEQDDNEKAKAFIEQSKKRFLPFIILCLVVILSLSIFDIIQKGHVSRFQMMVLGNTGCALILGYIGYKFITRNIK